MAPRTGIKGKTGAICGRTDRIFEETAGICAMIAAISGKTIAMCVRIVRICDKMNGKPGMTGNNTSRMNGQARMRGNCNTTGKTFVVIVKMHKAIDRISDKIGKIDSRIDETFEPTARMPEAIAHSGWAVVGRPAIHCCAGWRAPFRAPLVIMERGWFTED